MTTDHPIYAVILAGGSGTRFWPASRRLEPKQLLPLGPTAPQSLIEATVGRLSGLVQPERILIATGSHLVEPTRVKLGPDQPYLYLAEPRARNTAPCIAWAARIVSRSDPEAIVCVLPSDQHATNDEEFRRVLERAALAASEGTITTIGIVPTRPETGYGYIQKAGLHSTGVHEVARFVEKPDRETAEAYLASGDYLWNAGIFVFRARDMVDAIDTFVPDMKPLLDSIDRAAGTVEEQNEVEAFFAESEPISIDYAVMEKVEKLFVVPGDFGWSDLGSWESAWELSSKDEWGNAAPRGAVLVQAKNNLVQDLRTDRERAKVIAILGLDDLCVVETDDALLVMPRERSQDVREIVERLKRSGRDDSI